MTIETSEADADSPDHSQAGRSPLILFPGMGADARMFSSQRLAFPELVVPRWIAPEDNESLSDYAARLAKEIDPGVPCFVGGVSLGGVVALEVATHLKTRECFLFGSIRDPREMPKRIRVFRPISNLIMLLKWVSPFLLTYAGRCFHPTIRGVLYQLKDADSQFLRWAAGAILKWKPSPRVSQVRVVQIHGDRDWVFPIGRVVADKKISGGGHLMSLTHAAEVNPFVRERMNNAPEWNENTETASD